MVIYIKISGKNFFHNPQKNLMENSLNCKGCFFYKIICIYKKALLFTGLREFKVFKFHEWKAILITL